MFPTPTTPITTKGTGGMAGGSGGAGPGPATRGRGVRAAWRPSRCFPAATQAVVAASTRARARCRSARWPAPWLWRWRPDAAGRRAADVGGVGRDVDLAGDVA